MNTTKLTGKVKYFDDVKNFGFIKPDIEGEDLFFHASNVIGMVGRDDRVTYDTFQGKRGINAKNVTKIKE